MKLALECGTASVGVMPPEAALFLLYPPQFSVSSVPLWY
jgi:hypothetical protein